MPKCYQAFLWGEERELRKSLIMGGKVKSAHCLGTSIPSRALCAIHAEEHAI